MENFIMELNDNNQPQGPFAFIKEVAYDPYLNNSMFGGGEDEEAKKEKLNKWLTWFSVFLIVIYILSLIALIIKNILTDKLISWDNLVYTLVILAMGSFLYCNKNYLKKD